MISRNIVFTAPQTAGLLEQPVADPQADEVQLTSVVSLISPGTERFCFTGMFEANTCMADWVRYPFNPGYSSVARITKLNQSTNGLKEGDLVFSLGTHSEVYNFPAGMLLRVPEGVSPEEAGWGAISFITQTGVRRAEHPLGDSAVVIGLGPIGQMVVQYLHVLGLKNILVVDTIQKRIDQALRRGATAGFCGPAENALEFIKEHLDAELAPVVYDVTGHWSVLPAAIRLVRRFGKLILLGHCTQPTKQHLVDEVMTRQITIIGTQNALLPPAMAEWTREKQLELFFTYCRRKQINTAELITHAFQPAEAQKAYLHLVNPSEFTLGMMFDWRNL